MPTDKSAERARAEWTALINSAAEYRRKGDFEYWSDESVADFSAMAVERERKECAKSMCKQCADTFFWSKAELRGDRWIHSCLNVPGVAPCQAEAIWARDAERG